MKPPAFIAASSTGSSVCTASHPQMHNHFLNLTLAALLAFMACSCRQRHSPYSQGLALVGSDADGAAKCFIMAIVQGDSVAKAHYQLAMLWDKAPGKAGLVAWNLSEYLRLSDGLSQEERDDAEEWLRKTEKKLSIAINRRLGEDITDETSMRLRMLEEHAARQKLWIQELTTENIMLRNQLAAEQEKKD